MKYPLLLLTLLLLTLSTPTTTYAQILINEIAWMGTDVSASDEWIELYNVGNSDVDLTNWTLKSSDGSPNITLTGNLAAGQYYLLERTDDDTINNITANLIYSGALSNTTEHIQLFDAGLNLVDELNAAEGWPGGDNTTKQTLERTATNSWQTSLNPLGTPKAQNSAGPEPAEEAETEGAQNQPEVPVPQEQEEAATPQTGSSGASETVAKADKGDIAITEIFPNPVGIDNEKEFFEIENVSGRTIDVTGWKLTNSAKQEFIFPSLTMNHGSLTIFYRSQTKLVLNNTKDKITLYTNKGKIISQVEYKTSAPEAKSYQLDSDKKWQWAEPSPNQKNTLTTIVEPVPRIEGPNKTEVGQIITFDASDSFDPLNRELKFHWEFGDGRQADSAQARQIYLTPGKFEVTLTVTADNAASSTETLKIEVAGLKKSDLTATTTATTGENILTPTEIPFIFISEFMPNPDGADAEGEFIELFNGDSSQINLKGWKLSDSASSFTFDEELIKPNQYLAVWRSKNKISLNNDEDEIRLIAPDGRIADLVSYQDAKEGQSFVLDEKFIWQLSQTPSPGEINILDEVKDMPKSTTTPKVLGVQTEEEIPINQPANKTKYWVAGMSGVFAFGLGLALKRRPK